MILTKLTPLLLLPFAAADGMHRMKLKKLPAIAHQDPALAVAHLAQKYGSQRPLAGAGGLGRKFQSGSLINSDRQRGGDDLLWTQSQEELFDSKGLHKVPLSSKTFPGMLAGIPRTDSLLDFMNAQYFTEIQLGSPSQTVCCCLLLESTS